MQKMRHTLEKKFLECCQKKSSPDRIERSIRCTKMQNPRLTLDSGAPDGALRLQMNLQMDYLCCNKEWICAAAPTASQIHVVHPKNDPTQPQLWRVERNSSDGVLSLFSDTRVFIIFRHRRICGNRGLGCVMTHARRGFGENCVRRTPANRFLKFFGATPLVLHQGTFVSQLTRGQRGWEMWLECTKKVW